MHKITLVCSSHHEHGHCNAGELLKILQEIEPEVFFEEIRPSDFDSYYKDQKDPRSPGDNKISRIQVAQTVSS